MRSRLKTKEKVQNIYNFSHKNIEYSKEKKTFKASKKKEKSNIFNIKNVLNEKNPPNIFKNNI